MGGFAMWAGFLGLVLSCLLLDFFVLGGNKDKKISLYSAAGWSVFWVILAFAFAGFIYWDNWVLSGAEIAKQKTQEFITGYLLEKSLSLDNLFVFLLIFQYFQVPAIYQRRVLLFGILTAIFLRVVMILGGAYVINHFHWVLYLFGAFLIFTGIKMIFIGSSNQDLSKNPLLVFLNRHLNVTKEHSGHRFFIRFQQKIYVTPLFLVFCMIELTDVIFALDSIPAIFAITKDPFIVFSSNIFAIMGLRALYFLLAGVAERFHFLKYGLGLVLIFVGCKMLIEKWVTVPSSITLSIVGTIVLLSMLISWMVPLKKWAKKNP